MTNSASEKKILIVDDDPMILSFYRMIFEEFPALSIDTASNGENAMTLLGVNVYNLVILDIDLPIIDGIELTSHIRSTISKQIPIIIISGMGSHRIEECISVGATEAIEKPFRPELLINKIQSLFASD